MKLIFRKWILLDITGFVGGAGSFWYLRYMEEHPMTSTGLTNLWPNLTAGLFGTWLSVRFIDASLNAHATRENQRFKTIDLLRDIRTASFELTPDLYETRIRHLKNLLRAFDELWPRRSRHLDESEKHDSQTAAIKARELLNIASQCRKSEYEWKYALEETQNTVGYQFFENAERTFRKFKFDEGIELAADSLKAFEDVKHQDSLADLSEADKDKICTTAELALEVIRGRVELFTKTQEVEEAVNKARSNIFEEQP